MIEIHLAKWLQEHPALKPIIDGCVYAIDAAEDRDYPCLVYHGTRSESEDQVEDKSSKLVRETTDVTIFAKSIADLDRVGRALEQSDGANRIDGYRGVMEGAFVHGLFVQQIQPEEGSPEPTGDERSLLQRHYEFQSHFQASDVPALT